MELEIQIENHNYIIKLSQEFKEEDCTLLREALENACKSFCHHLILDCRQLKNINISGQRVLLSYLSKLQALDMLLIFCTKNTDIERSFQLSGLNKLIPIVPSMEIATALNRYV